MYVNGKNSEYFRSRHHGNPERRRELPTGKLGRRKEKGSQGATVISDLNRKWTDV